MKIVISGKEDNKSMITSAISRLLNSHFYGDVIVKDGQQKIHSPHARGKLDCEIVIE